MSACPTCQADSQDPTLKFCGRCGSDLSTAPADDGPDAWIGRVVDERYRVLARIGVGGMGVVYRVEHVRMGKIAAMKVLHRDLAGDAHMLRRFRREVEVVSKLNHPNIVQTFDFGQWQGLLYLVMEYVKGDSLGAIVRRDGPMVLARALPLGIQICSALDEAHHAGVIHRDLKPENIVCVRRRNDGEHAKVLDFGLAKLRERTDLAEITGAGHVVGTPYYMSPEQVRSEPVDPRTDIYSLGATLYRVITGAYPFEAETPMAVLARHLNDDLVPPSRRAPDRNLPAEIDAIIGRAMARRPDDRYRSAAELRRDLEALLGIRPNHVTPGPTAGESEGEASEPAPEAEPHAMAQTMVARATRPVPRPSAAISSATAAEILPEAGRLSAPEESAELSDDLDRLRREDLEEFDRVVYRRRRTGSLVLVPLLMGALGFGGYTMWRRTRPEKPRETEIEPNDSPKTASLLPRGIAVYGHVGKPHGDEPDFDYYRIPAGAGPRTVTAMVSGIPDIDLVLELFDDQGARLAKVDGNREGEPEILGPVLIGKSDAYVRARPVWTAGQRPEEGSSTPYSLTVNWARPRQDFEIEPNDAVAEATVIDAAGTLKGYLASPEDQDFFVVKVPPGQKLEAAVAGIDGVDIEVAMADGKTRINKNPAGKGEDFTAAPESNGVVTFAIVEHAPAAKKPEKGGDRTPVPAPVRAEREQPYSVEIRFRK